MTEQKIEYIPAYKNHCPITAYPEWGEIEHPTLGMVMTYGGPYDTYTLPFFDDDGDVVHYRYDHDEGNWIHEPDREGGWMIVTENLCCCECADRIQSAVQTIIDQREIIRNTKADLNQIFGTIEQKILLYQNRKTHLHKFGAQHGISDPQKTAELKGKILALEEIKTILIGTEQKKDGQ